MQIHRYYIFVADSIGLTAVNVMQLAQRAAVLLEIMHNDGQWTAEGHLVSRALVPIRSPYVTSNL